MCVWIFTLASLYANSFWSENVSVDKREWLALSMIKFRLNNIINWFLKCFLRIRARYFVIWFNKQFNRIDFVCAMNIFDGRFFYQRSCTRILSIVWTKKNYTIRQKSKYSKIDKTSSPGRSLVTGSLVFWLSVYTIVYAINTVGAYIVNRARVQTKWNSIEIPNSNIF